MAKEQALVRVESAYPVLAGDVGEVLATMRENLGNEQITPFDLDRVTVPAGGQLAWTVPGVEGEEIVKELEGVILHQQLVRSYWKNSIDEGGGGNPPDCYSPDSIKGIGDPGFECATCPFAQFGSDDRERGQACKQMRMIALLRPGMFLPTIVVVPPSSLKNTKQYLFRLAAKNTPVWGVVTKLTLEQDKNVDGIKFSRIKPEVVRVLNAEERQAMQAFVATIKPSLERVRTEAA